MQKYAVCLLSALCLGLPLQARAVDAAPSTTATAAAPAASAPAAKIDPLPEIVTELTVTDRVIGTGKPALKNKEGKKVAFHYAAWIYDPKAPEGHGKKFADTRDTDKPYMLSIGEGRVIRGLEAGLIGMKAGGKRTLVIPAYLGYGGTPIPGKVPAHSDLIFEVEMLAVEEGAGAPSK